MACRAGPNGSAARSERQLPALGALAGESRDLVQQGGAARHGAPPSKALGYDYAQA